LPPSKSSKKSSQSFLIQDSRSFINSPPQEIGQYIKDIREAATMTPGKLKIEAVKADPTEDKYLVCAVEGKADFIVFGDHHLKDLNVFLGIRIIDPVTFLQMLE
jgi:uncharacterized protein